MPRATSRRFIVAGLGTAGMWAWDFYKGQLTLAAFVLLVVWWLARYRQARRFFRVALLLSPFVTVPLRAATSTCVAYLAGNATLARNSWGKPGAESRNLDREYRAFWSGGSCYPDLGSLAVATVKQATFVALFHIIGPMPGAYVGPYPGKGEARALVASSGVELDVTSWEIGELTLGGRTLRVDSRWRAAVGSEPVKRASAVLSDNCAIILVETANATSLTLVDLGGFGWFATYRGKSTLPRDF